MKDVYVSPKKQEYDAIVVGSGITGGWAAKELCEKGLKTLVLEFGRDIEPGKDYVTEHKPNWEFTYRGLGDRKLFAEEYPIQNHCYAFGEPTKHLFVNDRDNPYTTALDKPFYWIRGHQVGGRSLTWGRTSLRWSDLDFEANAEDGYGVDWPIRYRDIAPWYDQAEAFAGICGQAEGLQQLPDGKFLPPMPMNCVEQLLKERLKEKFGRTLTHARNAVLTVPHKGRAACHYCGPCERGCSTGSYFSSLSATLPAARATGNMTLRPHSVVHSVIYDERKGRATGVRVIDGLSKQSLEFYGRVIFLCASCLGSTQILLNSATRRFPDGLANSSGALGHYLMDHCGYLSGAVAEMPGFEDKYYLGHRPASTYLPRFRNVTERRKDFVRGYGLSGGAFRSSWERGMQTVGFGADFKREMGTPGPWQLRLVGSGECLPRYENHVEIDKDKVDAWGVPVLKISCAFGENEQRMRNDMAVSAAEMLEAAGAKNVQIKLTDSPPGLSIHEMGTCRMGRDPKTSVLNGYNQAHDIPNLFVTDGAAMASSACQNPSLTYMALTIRAADYAVQKMKRFEL